MNKMNNKIIGNVYMLKCNTTQRVYIGSTQKDIGKRLKSHLSCYKRYLKNKDTKYLSLYYSSFEIIKNNNYSIKLLEKREFNNKKSMFELENEYIIKYKDKCVNKIKAICRSTSQSKYYQKNKKYINRKTTCQCGSYLYKRHLSIHKKSIKHINYVNKTKLLSF